MKKLLTILIIFLLNYCAIAQNQCECLVKDTSLIEDLNKLELLFEKDSIFESRYVGESSRESDKFALFLKIYNEHSKEDLKCIIMNNKVDEIRAYAYLFLYANGVDARTELSQQPLHVLYLNGCIGHSFMNVDDFTEFAKMNNKRFKAQLK